MNAITRNNKKIFLAAAAFAVAFFILYASVFNQSFNLDTIYAWLKQAPPIYLVITLLLAPLVGVPLSPLLMCLAIVFPLWMASGIAAIVIFAHHVLVLALGHSAWSDWLRDKMRKRHLLPKSRAQCGWGENALFIFTTTWVPGVSYILKPVYLLLSDIKTKTYLTIGTLSQVLAALPYLFLGTVAEEGGLFWFSIAVFAVFLLAWLIKRHFRNRRLPVSDEIG